VGFREPPDFWLPLPNQKLQPWPFVGSRRAGLVWEGEAAEHGRVGLAWKGAASPNDPREWWWQGVNDTTPPFRRRPPVVGGWSSGRLPKRPPWLARQVMEPRLVVGDRVVGLPLDLLEVAW
jgi:hypothetical protein